ncbi:Uncharacterised protein [Peptostreptococcus anaerobius]|uniref:Uncharacterized protein n=1 Tax=Peptostreptococcus anaerobius TaxID=1261 RepID=A0A379CF10_9FIRM|nr:unknown [Peptostreptococcus anaerobius CAG:621]SUB60704.1 Uncharacterised protein [Peptostreptococcus anaerobius]
MNQLNFNYERGGIYAMIKLGYSISSIPCRSVYQTMV